MRECGAHPDVVGLIPAAGRGLRLRPFRAAKELLPAGMTTDAAGGGPRLKLVCEYSLDALRTAGIKRALTVIAEHKLDVFRTLGDGRAHGLELAYLNQENAAGLPAAIDCAFPWIEGRQAALMLPDTVIEPAQCCGLALDELKRTGADVVLGVFPTDTPEDLCPVELDAAGRVTALHDKVIGVEVMNSWGLAVWQPRFSAFLHYALPALTPQKPRELTLAEVLRAALQASFDIRGLPIEGGRFRDLGTPEALRRLAPELSGAGWYATA